MNIKLQNISPVDAVIQIEGEIGIGESFQFADASGAEKGEKISTYDRFSTKLTSLVESGVERLRVEIRSSGGSVQDALLIYAALAELAERGVEVSSHCYGFTASAATIIAQAASEGQRYVASSAMYLIHNSSTTIAGNASDAAGVADLLIKTDEQIATIYAARSGRNVAHFASIMARAGGRGEWLTPPTAVDEGLADVVENISPLKNIANQVKMFLQRIFDDSMDKIPINAEPQMALTLVDIEPTTPLHKQDPVIESDAVKLSQNQSAYGQDAAMFRD